MKIPHDLRKTARLARRLGWSIRLTGSGHLAWHTPTGSRVITPSTPGRGRAHANTVSDLRRAGLPI